MSLPQQKFREIVFQLLYSQDFAEQSATDIAKFLMGQFAIARSPIREAIERVETILAKRIEIDEKIASASKSYDFERIPKVERNILRLAIFELFHDGAIPPKVVIAEAIRLTRKFGTPEGGTFVNAIVDQLYKEKNTEIKIS